MNNTLFAVLLLGVFSLLSSASPLTPFPIKKQLPIGKEVRIAVRCKDSGGVLYFLAANKNDQLATTNMLSDPFATTNMLSDPLDERLKFVVTRIDDGRIAFRFNPDYCLGARKDQFQLMTQQPGVSLSSVLPNNFYFSLFGDSLSSLKMQNKETGGFVRWGGKNVGITTCISNTDMRPATENEADEIVIIPWEDRKPDFQVQTMPVGTVFRIKSNTDKKYLRFPSTGESLTFADLDNNDNRSYEFTVLENSNGTVKLSIMGYIVSFTTVPFSRLTRSPIPSLFLQAGPGSVAESFYLTKGNALNPIKIKSLKNGGYLWSNGSFIRSDNGSRPADYAKRTEFMIEIVSLP